MNLAVSRPEPIPFLRRDGQHESIVYSCLERWRLAEKRLRRSFTDLSRWAPDSFAPSRAWFSFRQSEAATEFVTEFQGKVSQSPKHTLLTSGIRAAYQRETHGRKGTRKTLQ